MSNEQPEFSTRDIIIRRGLAFAATIGAPLVLIAAGAAGCRSGEHVHVSPPTPIETRPAETTEIPPAETPTREAVAATQRAEEVAEQSFLRALPSSKSLALGIVGGNGIGKTSDIRSATKRSFDELNQAIALVHDRLDRLVKPGSKSTPVEENCRLWTLDDAQASWRLKSCLKNVVRGEYEYIFEARPRGGDDAAYRLVAAGEGLLDADGTPVVQAAPPGEPGTVTEGRPVISGRFGYDFDNLRKMLGEGPVGQVSVGYRILTNARLLNFALAGFAPGFKDRTITGKYELKTSPELGGSAVVVGYADLLTRNNKGAILRGDDQDIELTGISVGWNKEGRGRAMAETCTNPLGKRQKQVCAHIHQCWSDAGDVKFENFSYRDVKDLGWSTTECPEIKFEMSSVPDPKNIAGKKQAAEEVPDKSVEIPERVVVSQR